MNVRERIARAREMRRRDEELGQRYSDMGVLLGKRTGQLTDKGARVLTNYHPLADVMTLAGREVKRWGKMDKALRESGDPLALTGGFTGLSYKPLSDALTAVTFVAGDFSPYTATTYTPVFSATDPERAPMMYIQKFIFTVALAASPGTLLFTAGLGTASSSKNLGASVASATMGTSGTAMGMIEYDLAIRGTGSGTDARAYGAGLWTSKLTTSGAGTLTENQIYGYTALTFDSTLANGLWQTATGTATSCSMTTQGMVWASWN
jgi:hypothetical protein